MSRTKHNTKKTQGPKHDGKSRHVDNPKQKKQRRIKETNEVTHEIKRYSNGPQDFMISKQKFTVLVNDIAQSYGNAQIRIQGLAVQVLQEVAEDYLINLLSDAKMFAGYARRVTIIKSDIIAATIKQEKQSKSDQKENKEEVK